MDRSGNYKETANLIPDVMDIGSSFIMLFKGSLITADSLFFGINYLVKRYVINQTTKKSVKNSL
jgi:hypothetical protein